MRSSSSSSRITNNSKKKNNNDEDESNDDKEKKDTTTTTTTTDKDTNENSDYLLNFDFSHRHDGIIMNPLSVVGNKILPGNYVWFNKSVLWKQRPTEIAHGTFWMMRDIRATSDKPILSNDTVIDTKIAKLFPTLKVQSISSSTDGNNDGDGTKNSNNNINGNEKSIVTVPNYFIRKNRSRDPSAHCTLVAISYRDYGYQHLDTWIQPYQQQLQHLQQQHNQLQNDQTIIMNNNNTNDRIEIIRINVTEGWFSNQFLRNLIIKSTKTNTPTELHNTTFLCFANNNDDDDDKQSVGHFRDTLRMHNILPGYIYLLDGIGRVRFAGSGPANNDDIQKLVHCTKQLLAPLSSSSSSSSSRRARKTKTKRYTASAGSPSRGGSSGVVSSPSGGKSLNPSSVVTTSTTTPTTTTKKKSGKQLRTRNKMR